MARPSDTRSGKRECEPYIALLRGINVGGHNLLPMQDLQRIFRDAGCETATTYIQSGNVVFTASRTCAKRVPEAVTARIERSFGMQIPVLTRTLDDLRAIVAGNPFLADVPATNFKYLHVAFLASGAEPKRLADLQGLRSTGEGLESRTPGRREVYLYLSKGVGRTKLGNVRLDSALKTISSMRNWNTVLRLLALCEAAGAGKD